MPIAMPRCQFIGMCNLYTMTATVDGLRRVFGAFDGERDNLPPFDEIYPGKPAPVQTLLDFKIRK